MEECGELDEVFQVERHCSEEDGIAEGAQECRQPQPLDIEHRRDVEVHQQLIHQQAGKANGEQSGVLEAKAWNGSPLGSLPTPQDGKHATTEIPQHLEQIEL